MKIEEGKIYRVRHSRKGVFVLKVDSVDDEWAYGEVYQGQATAILNCNTKLGGDPITVRKSFLTIIEELEITKSKANNA